MLVGIGLVLLLVAYEGNPAAAFARVTSYLGGKSSTTPGQTGQPSPKAVSYVVPAGVKQDVVANPTQPITPTVSGGKPATAVPVADLTGWAAFWHWLQTDNPFNDTQIPPQQP